MKHFIFLFLLIFIFHSQANSNNTEQTPVPASATPSSTSINLLKNSDFAEDAKGWKMRVQGSAQAVKSTVPDGFNGKPALQFNVTTAGEAPSNVSFNQGSIKLVKDQTYHLSI